MRHFVVLPALRHFVVLPALRHFVVLPALRQLIALSALATLLLVPGCGGDDGDPRFATDSDSAIRCMQHQPEPPGPGYTDPKRADTAEVLQVLRYYTAHGRKPYCDGAGPTETDREWAQLYTQQGAHRANVAPLLD